MPTNRKIAFLIPFNNLNVMGKFTEANTKPWIEKRIQLFMNYTFKSLVHQSYQDFMAYILCSPASYPVVEEILSLYPPLPPNIQFIPSSQHKAKVSEFLVGSEEFFEIQLYSDDMYHTDFAAYIHSYVPQPTTEVLICQNGYIYSSPLDRLAKYYNISSSFNCFIYATSDYLAGKRITLSSYAGAILLPHELLPEPWYVNHCHDTNVIFSFELESRRNKIADVWNHHEGTRALFGEEITALTQKQQILSLYLGK